MAHGVARHTSATARLFLRLTLAFGAATLLLARPVGHFFFPPPRSFSMPSPVLWDFPIEPDDPI